MKFFIGIFGLKNLLVFLSLAILIFTSNTNKMKTLANDTGIQIQNSLDELIKKLEKNNIDNNYLPISLDNISKSNQDRERDNSKLKSLDFSDEIVDAFQKLNDDFLEYENLVTEKKSHNYFENHNDEMKNILNKFSVENSRMKNSFNNNNKAGLKKLRSYNENTYKSVSNNNPSTNKYYEEIDILSKDISNTFENYDKIELNSNKKKEIKQKLDVIKQIKNSLYQLHDKIQIVNNKQSSYDSKKEKMIDLANKIMELHNKYMNLEKKVDSKTIGEFQKIKEMVTQSSNSEKNMKEYMNIYKYMSDFYRKINLEGNGAIKSKELNQNIENLEKILADINRSDMIAKQIREEVEKNIEIIKKNSLQITVAKRVQMLNKYLLILENLSDYNKKILNLKNYISESLKTYSFSSLKELVNKINEKKTTYQVKQQKLAEVKNVFSLIKNIFDQKNFIQQTKDKIIEYIKEVNFVKEKIQKMHEIKEKERKRSFQKLIDEMNKNKSKLRTIHIEKENISKTKNKLIELSNVKNEQKKVKEEKNTLILKLEEIQEKEREEELRRRKEEELRKQREMELKEQRNQFFLQKIEQIHQIQNRTQIHSELITSHHQLINKLVKTLLYLKQLKEIHKHITDTKENIIIFEKIKQVESIVQEMKQIIKTTKQILVQYESNENIQNEYEKSYRKMIENVEILKFELKNTFTGENIENVRNKLKKLTDLYKILKTGSAHNALRIELMKKIVNINASMLEEMNIYKLKNEIDLLK